MCACAVAAFVMLSLVVGNVKWTHVNFPKVFEIVKLLKRVFGNVDLK